MTKPDGVLYWIGESVYLRTDPDQLERLVCAVEFRPSGVIYKLQYSDMSETGHYAFEISKAPDSAKKYTIN